MTLMHDVFSHFSFHKKNIRGHYEGKGNPHLQDIKAVTPAVPACGATKTTIHNQVSSTKTTTTTGPFDARRNEAG